MNSTTYNKPSTPNTTKDEQNNQPTKAFSTSIKVIYRSLPLEVVFMVLKQAQMDCWQFISKLRKNINVVRSSHFPHHKFYQVSPIPKWLNDFHHKRFTSLDIKIILTYFTCLPLIQHTFFPAITLLKRKEKQNKTKSYELSNLISRIGNLPEQPVYLSRMLHMLAKHPIFQLLFFLESLSKTPLTKHK